MAAANRRASDLDREIIGQAATVRAFMLSGAADERVRFEAADDQIALHIGRLSGDAANTPGATRLRDVSQRWQDWRRTSVDPLVALQQQGRRGEVLAAYSASEAIPKFERVEAALRALRAATSDEVAQAEAVVDERRRTGLEIASVVAAGTVVALVVVAVHAARRIAAPITDLERVLVDPASRRPFLLPRELRDLRDAIVSLRSAVQHEVDQVERAREGLTQNATAYMSLRAQLETTPGRIPMGWDAAAQLVPASGAVAGDCYVIDVSGNTMWVLVVDVAGHGPEAAVVALRARELLRAGLRTLDDPGRAVRWAHEQLTDLDPDMFVTAFAAIVDFGDGQLRYANAGHPPPVISNGVSARLLTPTGPLIGPFPSRWQTGHATIAPGEVLACYTDGVIEARNRSGDEFGIDRVLNALNEGYGEPAQSLVKDCLDEIVSFTRDHARDDITLAIVQRADI